MANRFAENPIINITRTRFKMPQNVKTTFNAGQLIPLRVIEILPGDTFSVTQNSVVRMSTPIKPVMDNAWIEIMHFFVPTRLTWEHWPEFNGENNSSYWTQPVEYTIPQLTAPAGGWANGTIADYMGIPTGIQGISINALPVRALCQIWNDWFRDENLQQPTFINKGDETTEGTNGSNYITDAVTAGQPLPVAKIHDYFTSALPQPQKGEDVLLPLGNTAPVVGNGTALGVTLDGINTAMLSKDTGISTAKTSVYKAGNIPLTGLTDLSGVGAFGVTTDATKSGIIADLSEATAATINQLRQAFQLQKMFEKDARGGTRYTEILKNHFGVTASDARLQRAEYLGGQRVPITMQQVNQTSSTDATSPQGNTAAYSLTADVHHAFTKSFEEHGYVITVAFVRTQHTYQQGINKMWSRKSRTDFYMPVFANIGEQPILNKEIYAQGNEKDEEGFGYQEAWAEYRNTPNIITGQFRSNYAPNGGLDIWHYADYFTSLPTLGSDFIKETTANIDRTLAIQSDTTHQFLGDFYFETIATRPMPMYSIPGLIDHH